MLTSSNICKKLYVALLAMYFATIPIENVLETGHGSIHKFLGIGILALAVLLIDFRHFKIGKLKYLLIFVGICGLSLFWTFGDTGNDYLRTVLFLTFFTAIVLQVNLTHSEFEFLRFAICTVSAILSAMMIFGQKYQVVSLVDSGRYTIGINGSEVDNNNLCLALAFSILFTVDYLAKKRGKFKLYYIALATLSLAAMLFTGSRGGFLSLIAGLAGYMWIHGGGRIKPSSIFFCAAGVVFAYFLAIQILPETLLSRFTLASVVKSGGTGRTTIWLNALDAFWNGNPLRMIVGYGFGSFPQFLKSFCGMYKAAHNDFIQILIELGVSGCIYYIFCLCNALKRMKSKSNALSFAIIALLIIGGISMELFIKKMFWMGIFFSFINIVEVELRKTTVYERDIR